MIDIALQFPFPGHFVMQEAFGENPTYYRTKWNLAGHEGINWGLPEGTPVLAAFDGTVSRVFLATDRPPDQYPYGIYVFLAHTWGESVYAHLSSVTVNMNQVVKAGDKIGLSGHSGATDNRETLHFGIRFMGYNPDDGFRGYSSPHRFLPEVYSPPPSSIFHSPDEHPDHAVLCRSDFADIPIFTVANYAQDVSLWIEVATGSAVYPIGWIEIPGNPPRV